MTKQITSMTSKAAAELLWKNPDSNGVIWTQVNRVLVKKTGVDRLGDIHTICAWDTGNHVVMLTRDEAIRLVMMTCPSYTKGEATSMVKTARRDGMTHIFINFIEDEDGNELGAWAGRGSSALDPDVNPLVKLGLQYYVDDMTEEHKAFINKLVREVANENDFGLPC